MYDGHGRFYVTPAPVRARAVPSSGSFLFFLGHREPLPRTDVLPKPGPWPGLEPVRPEILVVPGDAHFHFPAVNMVVSGAIVLSL